MVMLTDKAVLRFKKFLEDEKTTDYGVRIFVAGGG